MAFDLDDKELKATKELPCNKKQYNFKKKDPEDIAEKAIFIINEIFIKQAEENRKSIHRWFEIDYEDTRKLMIAIKTLINRYEVTQKAFERNEKIIDKMLDTFIGLNSDLEIVRQHARINTQEKKQEVLKIYEKICEDK